MPGLNIVQPQANAVVVPDQDFTVSGAAFDRGGFEPIAIDSVSVSVDDGREIPAQLTAGHRGTETLYNF